MRAGTIIVAIAMAVQTASIAESSPTNLITNGDFETGSLLPWTNVGFGNHTAQYGLVTSHDYFAVLGSYDFPSNGIWQSFPTLPGSNYTVSFDVTASWAPWTTTTPCLTTATVYDGNGVSGASLASCTYLTTQMWMFATYSFSFVASSNRTTLEFLDAGDGIEYDNEIDNVSVRSIPEPATLSLVALGGLAVLRRRR